MVAPYHTHRKLLQVLSRSNVTEQILTGTHELYIWQSYLTWLETLAPRVTPIDKRVTYSLTCSVTLFIHFAHTVQVSYNLWCDKKALQVNFPILNLCRCVKPSIVSMSHPYCATVCALQYNLSVSWINAVGSVVRWSNVNLKKKSKWTIVIWISLSPLANSPRTSQYLSILITIPDFEPA